MKVTCFTAKTGGTTISTCWGKRPPTTFFDYDAAERIADLVPGVKLVAFLRNPVDRAYSHWEDERQAWLESHAAAFV